MRALLRGASKAAQKAVEAELDITAAKVLQTQKQLSPEDTGEYKETFDIDTAFMVRKVGPTAARLRAKGLSPALPIFLNFGTVKMRGRPHIFLAARRHRKAHIRRTGKAVRQALRLARRKR